MIENISGKSTCFAIKCVWIFRCLFLSFHLNYFLSAKEHSLYYG